MFYKHKYFTLDTERKLVFDENNKKVHITSNAYILLLFLCENKQGNLTQIGDTIDRAADYNENDLRQLRYKIKVALGNNVISYKNHMYSLEGDVVATESLTTSTTLAQEHQIDTKDTSLTSTAQPIRPPRRSFSIYVMLTVISTLGALLFLIYNQFHTTTPKPKEVMTTIPEGDFVMGSTEAQALQGFSSCEEANHCVKDDYLAEYPQHTVFVPRFSIDTYEVSNSDYQLFTKATNHQSPQYTYDSNLNQPNQPVVGVSWYDAKAYCEWLGKRLPTEAEWEKSARGIHGDLFPWGNTWSSSKSNHGTGGTPGTDASDGYTYTAPVGVSLGVSQYGIFNSVGNVAEWTNDTFAPYEENNKFTNSAYNQNQKVVKGGAYDQDKSMQRPAARYYFPPANSDIDIGFRCAKS